MEKLVLFVCEHGAAKSVIAAAIFNKNAEARGLPVRAESRAGGDPQLEPSPPALEGLAAEGLTPPSRVPTRVSSEDLARADRVISVDDVPPVSAGYQQTRNALAARVDALISSYEAVG